MLANYTSPIFYLPDGPKNLSGIFPLIDFGNVAEYYVELKDDTDVVLLRTNTLKTGCCCSNERVRLHFLNALGCFDAVNFNPPRILHSVTSSEFKNVLPDPFSKTDSQLGRFNVRSNETYEAMTDCYTQEAQQWLMELADSTIAFMEWTGTQGQPDSYIPIKILDKDGYEVKKNENEHIYQFKITFRVSNENIIQRN